MAKDKNKRSMDATFGELIDLARSYDFSEDDTRQNKRKAISIYRKLARKGHPIAQYMLSLHYSLGQYIRKNKRRSRYWLTKAAEGGYAEAQYYIALELLIDNKHRDDKAIFEWVEKAAMQGHVRALSYLAHCYQWGTGVEQDDEMAVTIYRLLADNDIPDGLYHLGHCYQYGCGVEKDLIEAERLYRRAIELNDTRAELQLDNMLHPKEKNTDEEEDNSEPTPKKHPIGRRLIRCILATMMLSSLFGLLSVCLFENYATILKVYAGYRHSLFDGFYFKWPIIFVLLTWMSTYTMLVVGSISLCKREHGNDHIIMQDSIFKRMLLAIIGIMLFIVPTFSRVCIGISEYHLETGCIIGRAEAYHNLYLFFESMGILAVVWLISLQLSWDIGVKRLKNACRIVFMSMAVISGCGMAYLNLRIQPWLILPYIFTFGFVACASIIIMKRMYAAALKAI